MIVLNGRRLITIATCLFIGMFVFILQINQNDVATVETVTLPVSGKVVVVDAGHRKTR